MKNDIDKYPYFAIATLDALEECDEAERASLIRRLAVQVGDPVVLRTILGLDPEEFLAFYPDMKLPELSTVDTIDTFIDEFAKDKPLQAETLEDLLPAQGATYSLADLEALPEIDEDSLQNFQNIPIPNSNAGQLAALDQEQNNQKIAKTVKKPVLSESLAKVLIKNGNYRKALEIITEISLNNPKKSIYFAHQIRFLRKLIALEDAVALN